MKSILALLVATSTAVALPCEMTAPGLMKYERQILEATEKFEKKSPTSAEFLNLVARPLDCILRIQEKAEAHLKILANSFLKALMGGGQIKDVPKDRRYEVFSKAMTAVAEQSALVLRDSLPAAHFRGAWGLYQGFCGPKNNQYCTDFLPNEDMIDKQSPLLGASSIIMLRQAYYSLDGQNRRDVAERIKNLYQKIPPSERLKRKVITEIYQELFPVLTETPLS